MSTTKRFLMLVVAVMMLLALLSSVTYNDGLTIHAFQADETPTPSLTLANTATPIPIEIVIDNTDPGFSVAGFWLTYSGAPYPHYGVDFRYSPAGVGNDTATFRPNITVAGDYEVFIWFGTSPEGATNAPYTVQHAGGATVVPVNMNGPAGEGGYWTSLGIYTFETGTSGLVQLFDDANGYVVADAIRLLQVGGP